MSETGDEINMTDDTEGHVVRNVDEEGVEAVEAEGADDTEGHRVRMVEDAGADDRNLM